MERRSEIHDYREHANSNSAPFTAWNSNEALNTALPNDSNSNPAINSGIGSSSGGGGGGGAGGGGDRATKPCMIREQDQYMPIANVIRIMRRILPPHAKISDDAKETIQECVSEYISFITAEANERCQHEQRKTVTAEDVLWAMSKLGFDDYVEPLAVYLNRYRQAEADRTNLGRHGPFLRRGSGSTSGAFVGGGSGGGGGGTNVMGMNMMDYGGGIAAPPPPPPPPLPLNIGGVGPYGPGFNMGPYPGPGMFDPMGAYLRDGSGGVGFGGGGGSTPQNLFGGYDPFAQFK